MGEENLIAVLMSITLAGFVMTPKDDEVTYSFF